MDTVLPAEIAKLAARVVAENKAAGRMVAIAESCTGGLVAAAITEVPGSSAVLGYGFVTYSNDAKIKLLGVNEDIIDAFGAVSVGVSWAMAQGALKKSGADIAFSTRGSASLGPGPSNSLRGISRAGGIEVLMGLSLSWEGFKFQCCQAPLATA
jgi:nicotinamide-nucleotide amidase